jgi:hypothetical protein
MCVRVRCAHLLYTTSAVHNPYPGLPTQAPTLEGSLDVGGPIRNLAQRPISWPLTLSPALRTDELNADPFWVTLNLTTKA